MSNREEKWKKYEAGIEDYLTREFFSSNDRKLVFYVGRYYNTASYNQQTVLKNTSLAGNLPNLTKKINEGQVYRILKACDKTLKQVAGKQRKYFLPGSSIRSKIHELISSMEKWESSPEELSLAFMMGYEFYAPTSADENVKDDKEEIENKTAKKSKKKTKKEKIGVKKDEK